MRSGTLCSCPRDRGTDAPDRTGADPPLALGALASAVEAADDGLVPAPQNARRDWDETAPPPRVCQKKRCVLMPYADVGVSIASGDGRLERASAGTGERHRP